MKLPLPEYLVPETNLPTRITGIVFWGTVLVGLLIALVMLSERAQFLQKQHQRDANFLSIEIAQALLSQNEIGSDVRDQLNTLISKLQPELGFEAVSLPLPQGRFVYGSVLAGQQMLVMPNTAHSIPDGLLIYFPSLDREMAQERKHVLVSIGLLVMTFGLILKLILRNLLSRPFSNMMETAKRITEGDTVVRFQTDGADEFSSLSAFINQALDLQASQHEQIQEALSKVRHSEAELSHEKERLDVIVHSIADAIIVTDAQGVVQYLNPVAESLLGITNSYAIGQPVKEIVQLRSDQTGLVLEDPLTGCLQSMKKVGVTENASLVCADRRRVAVEASAAPMFGKDDVIIGAVMSCQDVSQTRLLTTQLSYQACHDTLTDLVNRREFERRLEVVIENARSSRRQHVLMYLDLDRFKAINDTCGHAAGDQLLVQLASFLEQNLRASDTLARLGGDEFGVLLEGCSLERGVEIGKTMLKSVSEFRFAYMDKYFQIGVSIGITRIDAETVDLSSVMSEADAACYAAKHAGRNRIEVFAGLENV